MDKAISLKIILHDEISKNTWNFKIPFFTQYFVIHIQVLLTISHKIYKKQELSFMCKKMNYLKNIRKV